MPTPTQKKHRPLTLGLIFAGAASVLEHTSIHWLDTWLRRVQNSKKPVQTWDQKKQAGWGQAYGKGWTAVVRSLHKGFWTSGVYKLLSRMMVFGGQQPTASWLNEKMQPVSSTGVVAVNALAGGSVAAMQVILTPLDTMKIKKQNADARTTAQMIREENMKLFKGASATLLRNVPGAIVQFTVWSAVNLWLNERDKTSFSCNCAASILGALAAVIVTNPQDVIKTMVQAQTGSVSTGQVAREAYQQLGISGLLTRGLGLRSLIAGPKYAIPLIVTGYFWGRYDRFIEANTTNAEHIERVLGPN